MDDPEVRVLTFVRASVADIRGGLLAYLSVSYGNLVLKGIVLRRTTDGRLALSFPARTDRTGRKHPYILPANDDARQRIEAAIIKAITVSLSEVLP